MNQTTATPLLEGLTEEDIRIAAERWMALTTHSKMDTLSETGFEEEDRQSNPNRRVLNMHFVLDGETLETESQFTKATRNYCAYKLTQVADLVRARVLEAAQS